MNHRFETIRNNTALKLIKVKAGKGKNDFYRVNAILLPTLDSLKEVEAVNPFAELFDELFGED